MDEDEEMFISFAGDYFMAVVLVTVKQYMRVNTDRDDSLVQSLLDAAEGTVKSILGLEDSASVPDNPRVDLALNYLTLFYYENRSFIKPENCQAVMKIVTGLLDRDKNHAAFMPEVD